MGVPKRKISKSRRDKRRAHQRLKAPSWVDCPGCGETMQRHRVCLHCGEYRGRQVLKIVEKKRT